MFPWFYRTEIKNHPGFSTSFPNNHPPWRHRPTRPAQRGARSLRRKLWLGPCGLLGHCGGEGRGGPQGVVQDAHGGATASGWAGWKRRGLRLTEAEVSMREKPHRDLSWKLKHPEDFPWFSRSEIGWAGWWKIMENHMVNIRCFNTFINGWFKTVPPILGNLQMFVELHKIQTASVRIVRIIMNIRPFHEIEWTLAAKWWIEARTVPSFWTKHMILWRNLWLGWFFCLIFCVFFCGGGNP